MTNANKADKLRFIVNSYMEVVLEDDKPVIYIAGKPIAYCAFLVVSLEKKELEETNSIDELASRKDARRLEGKRNLESYGISVEENFWGHCSAIQAWYELGYDTRAIAANLSFPLLKELARAGDPTAKKVISWEIESRLKEDDPRVSITIVDTCGDLLSKESWNIILSTKHQREMFEMMPLIYFPVYVYNFLAENSDAAVQYRIANYPPTPKSAFSILAKSKYPQVRGAVADNSSDPEILDQLSRDKNWVIRRTVAGNENTSVKTIASLADDDNSMVRTAIALNFKTPIKILDRLTDDKIPFVCEMAKRSLYSSKRLKFTNRKSDYPPSLPLPCATYDKFRICFANIGEGFNGTYDPNNPRDENLLRVEGYVYNDDEWETPTDCTMCTNMTIALSHHAMQNVLSKAMIQIRKLRNKCKPNNQDDDRAIDAEVLSTVVSEIAVMDNNDAIRLPDYVEVQY